MCWAFLSSELFTTEAGHCVGVSLDKLPFGCEGSGVMTLSGSASDRALTVTFPGSLVSSDVVSSFWVRDKHGRLRRLLLEV